MSKVIRLNSNGFSEVLEKLIEENDKKNIRFAYIGFCYNNDLENLYTANLTQEGKKYSNLQEVKNALEEDIIFEFIEQNFIIPD